MERLAGLILCGGRSRRMGSDKALLEWEDGTPLLARVDRVLSAVCSEILLATSDPEPYRFLGRRSVADAMSGIGPLGGLIAGLEALAAFDAVLVCACDLPHVGEETLKRLARLLLDDPRADAVIPVTSGGDEPLLAAYRPGVARLLRVAAKAGRLQISHASRPCALEGARVVRVEADRISATAATFLNVNDPDQLEQARRVGGRAK